MGHVACLAKVGPQDGKHQPVVTKLRPRPLSRHSRCETLRVLLPPSAEDKGAAEHDRRDGKNASREGHIDSEHCSMRLTHRPHSGQRWGKGCLASRPVAVLVRPVSAHDALEAGLAAQAQRPRAGDGRVLVCPLEELAAPLSAALAVAGGGGLGTMWRLMLLRTRGGAPKSGASSGAGFARVSLRGVRPGIGFVGRILGLLWYCISAAPALHWLSTGAALHWCCTRNSALPSLVTTLALQR